MSEKPTPRTDAAEQDEAGIHIAAYSRVPTVFARQLERELAEKESALQKHQLDWGIAFREKDRELTAARDRCAALREAAIMARDAIAIQGPAANLNHLWLARDELTKAIAAQPKPSAGAATDALPVIPADERFGLQLALFVDFYWPPVKFSEKVRLELHRQITQIAQSYATDAGDRGELASLLQQMLHVAENCDETGYADGYGFVDLDKLHAKVRAALSAPSTPSRAGGETEK